MTILRALTQLYSRMEALGEVPRLGYSSEKISFALVIDNEGHPRRLADKRSLTQKKPAPTLMNVPAGSRTSGIKPNLLWDKTAYVFGVTAVEEEDVDGVKSLAAGQGKRTAEEHRAFVEKHRELLADATDPGLIALHRFMDRWRPEMFVELEFSSDALDQNIVFEFEDDNGPGFIHERAESIKLFPTPSKAERGLCLVTGEVAPIERLHLKIKGVMDAQSSGASLVSFNSDAYESFGKSQGDNAPVSERAVFAYGTALNALLARGSIRNTRMGDTTVAFWAEAPKPETASFAEQLMSQAFQPPDDDAALRSLRGAISDVAEGRSTDLDLDDEVKVYILGLAPNAARLSVRFWYPGRFEDFARHIDQFWKDLDIMPNPWKGFPAAWSLLYETAIRVNGKPNKADTIPPQLSGQLMRSVLTGKPLPSTLLSAITARIRADGDINGRRAAICRAVINRTTKKEEIPVSLDPDNPNPAYRLGRLFAVLERAQSAALPGINATIKDRYFAAASATPARVFPLLVKNATHHLALLKKGEKRVLGHWLEKELGVIWLGLDADIPPSLLLEDQGRFIAGYYHQRWTKTSKEEAPETHDGVVETQENEK